jgi:hypothetical protein
MSAVGGQQTIRVKGRRPREKNESAPVPTDSLSATGAHPSILSEFEGEVPAATYGVAAFCAVGGNQTIGSNTRTSSASMNVLPNSDGRNFPQPVNGRYDDGSYSSVAGHSSTENPSVLRGFRRFEVRDARFLPAAYSAVGGNQEVIYSEEGEGEDLGENAD